jgi:DivIVA domain-containing protein
VDPTPDRIVRRDFPRVLDGYDPAAVDAHLEAIAALVGDDSSGLGASAADHDLLAAGRLLLGQIAAVRAELRNASASLRDQSRAIGETLDRLLDLDEAPGAARAGTSEPSRPAADPVGPEPPPPAAVSAPAEEVDASTLADARIVALDMALGGSNRDEIGGELGRRFGLPEPFALADEVLAALG